MQPHNLSHSGAQKTPIAFANYDQLNFPSASLLEDIFAAPAYTRSGSPPIYRLAGGAGLTHDDLMPSAGYLSRRAGYQPGTSGAK